jgi:hypothetical protein
MDQYHNAASNRVVDGTRALSKVYGGPLPDPLTEAALAADGWYIVQPDAPPAIAAGQVAQRSALPVHLDGVSRHRWTVRDMTRAELHDAVDQERDRRVDLGAAFMVPGVAEPVPVPGRQPYREIIQAKFSAAQGFKAQGVTEASVLFRDGNNVNHLFTPDQMLALCLQSMRWYEATMKVSWDMKDGTGAFADGIPLNFTSDEYWT